MVKLRWPPTNWFFTTALLAWLGACGPSDVIPTVRTDWQEIEVLDGDTFIVDGVLVRLAGADAPELGPWAECWAEAALAGGARDYAIGALSSDPFTNETWRIVEASELDESGRVRARLISSEGSDLSDEMVVYGYAANTTGNWDWCSTEAELVEPTQDDPGPHGPNLWWPMNHMFDARAGD